MCVCLLCVTVIILLAGVYPEGAPSHGYVDFSYVGGTQNPLKDPVPRGSLNFTATLPNGVYHYKYMLVFYSKPSQIHTCKWLMCALAGDH